MPRKQDPANAERNRAITLRAEAGATVPDLSAEFNLDPSTIYHILKEEGVKAPSARAQKRERKPVNQRHIKLGVVVHSIRHFQKHMNTEQFSREVGLSTTKLINLEKGYYSPTLVELERIAAFVGLQPEDLFSKSQQILQGVVTCRAA